MCVFVCFVCLFFFSFVFFNVSESDSSYLEFKDKEEEIQGLENVSTLKMAGTNDPDSMTAAVIKAPQIPISLKH